MLWHLFKGFPLLQWRLWEQFWLNSLQGSGMNADRSGSCTVFRTILSSPSVSLPASSTWPGPHPHWAGSTDGNLWIFSNLAGTRCPDFLGQDIFSLIFLSLSYFFHSFSYNLKVWNHKKKWWIFQQTQNFILPFLDQYSYPALILEMILYWRYSRETLICTEQ